MLFGFHFLSFNRTHEMSILVLVNKWLFQLDLHEANRKLANGAARAGEETSALKMQLDEQKKQLEDQRRKLEEHKKGLDSKSRQLEEKEKSIADVDQKLKKRKEKLDQLEAQIQKVN